MSHNKRRHNHDSISPIKAVQVCSNVQNEILKIKKFKASPGNSKEYVNHLRDEIIKSMGTIFLFLINAENNKSVDVKIESLYSALNETRLILIYLTTAARISAIKAKTGTHISNMIHDLQDSIKHWIKYIENK